MKTIQEKFWSSKFGEEYAKRNYRSDKELDSFYIKNLGVSRSKINKKFLGKLKLQNILEVGCNAGNQLTMLQHQGFKSLYGIELFDKIVEEAKNKTRGLNIIQGSAFDIPFKDSYFDLVFTSSLLIHISPTDIQKALSEIHRVSKKYIWGYEYYNDSHIGIDYRGNKNRLWKGNFAKMYLDKFPDLKLVREERFNWVHNDNVDTVYLLKKI